MASTEEQSSRTRWISTGFEALVHELSQSRAVEFDVLFVGSGYGGSIACAEIARHTSANGDLRIAILERGREYLPGMFPAHESELPAHMRFSTADSAEPRGTRDGLMDIRVGPDVCAIVGNGLGGGSLINAGVMLQPDDFVFRDWPAGIDTAAKLQPFFDEARRLLGAVTGTGSKTILDHQRRIEPVKHAAMKQLGGADFRSAPITVSMSTGANQSGINVHACEMCGNCMTGCNFSAKNSLDENLLSQSYRHGVEIYTGATVLDLHRSEDDAGWIVRVVHSDPKLRSRETGPSEIRAKRVILAAGAFGSTEILLRSDRRTHLPLSKEQLGEGFSGNGDLMTAAYGLNTKVDALAHNGWQPVDAKVGPTITGMIDLRTGDERGIMIQEFAIPAPMVRIFKETCAVAHCLHQLAQHDDSTHDPSDTVDPLAVDESAMRRTLLLGVMGHDGAAGTIKLSGEPSDEVDGIATVEWQSLRDDESSPVFVNQMKRIEQLLEDSKLGAELLQNPAWRLMPGSLRNVFEMPNGPALTVHPLGGCRMATDATRGVVDHLGRVFKSGAGTDVYDDLVVLDGSVVPSALGVNPALTIAALSLRAARQLCAVWKLVPKTEFVPRALQLQRPIFRVPRPPLNDTTATEVAIVERLVGHAPLPLSGGGTHECVIELTLRFEPYPLPKLMGSLPRRLAVNETSRLRIFDKNRWQELVEMGESDHVRDAAALIIAPLSGHLSVLRRGASTGKQRRRRALAAWRKNRGCRDTWQEKSFAKLLKAFPLMRARDALASHAGEERCFDYELRIGPCERAEHLNLPSQFIRGRKRFTYDLHGNPWKQLMQVQLDEFPGLTGELPKLELDLRFLAAEGIPLLQIVRQRDHATALFDFLSFSLYLLRLVISIHIWSFRSPDPSPQQSPALRSLPTRLDGIANFEQIMLPPGDKSLICLTRYYKARTESNPVLLIHGYSANGNTFALPQLQPNLVTYLCEAERDVWVLDLRTSCSMPATSQLPWSFEEVALQDIRNALEHICKQVGAETGKQCEVDVVAHCMGAAMLSMAILDSGPLPQRPIQQMIGNVVLSQIGPMMVFTPANVFRGFAMSYLKYLFRFDEVSFQPEGPQGLADELLDRALSTLPYPDGEFEIENPPQFYRTTPFTRTRHRMDAWFGRVFSLKNMERHVLDRLDDLFGPVNLTTLLQTMHFARHKVIADRTGYNFGMTRQNLTAKWTMPTLSIHGMQNGLADIATLRRLEAVMQDAGVEHRICRLPEFGHQDCLIGRERHRVFAEIVSFLRDPSKYQPDAGNHQLAQPPVDNLYSSTDPSAPKPVFAGGLNALIDLATKKKLPPLQAETPWLGPVVIRDTATAAPTRVAVQANPQLGVPVCLVFVPIVIGSDGRCQLPAGMSVNDVSIHSWHSLSRTSFEEFDIPQFGQQASGALTLLLYDVHRAVKAGPFLHVQLPSLDANDQSAEFGRIASAVELYLRDEPVASMERGHIELTASAPGAPVAGYNSIGKVAAPPAQLCFAVASCQYQPGALDQQLAWASYARLDKQLDSRERRPQFLVLTGDQVYVDATAGLFDPLILDDRYRLPYEKLLRSDPVQRVFRKTAVYTMLDDHEIGDNWAPLAHDSDEHDDHLKAGCLAHLRYLRRVLGPPLRQSADGSTEPLWYSLDIGGFAFFFADTRTERRLRNASNAAEANLMSDEQCAALLAWIDEHHADPRPKFIVSPSILLPRRVETSEAARNPAATLHSDAWDGYPATFHRVLEKIAEKRPKALVFLSGDEHRSCLAQVSLRGHVSNDAVSFCSIHSSALYAPFPFANDLQQSLAGNEQFHFTGPRSGNRYECSVDTAFAPEGDGFAVIECTCDAQDRWILRVSYSRNEGLVGDHVVALSEELGSPLPA